jgi:ABC-type Fe3+/spermidine/putrescine transport system ATPase subunit
MEVSLRKVSKVFGGNVTAVDDFSVEIRQGELFFLLGPSGCGKTTILRMIAGFERPTQGQILFNGRVMNDVPPQKRNIGMVFQNYALWPHMTVEKNIEYGLTVRRLSKTEKKKRVEEVLDIVQMRTYADRYPNQLSGGQQQRIALARALVIKPELLLFDEPLSNLDSKLRLELRDEIKRIHEQTQITAVYVTHDQKEALSMADYVVIMKSGKLQQKGRPLDVYRFPTNRFVADFVGETNFIEGTIREVREDKTLLSSALGPLETPWHDSRRKVGQTVSLSLRPESVRVSEKPLGGVNEFPAEVERVVYLGEMEQYYLKVGPQISLRAWHFNPQDLGFKGRVYVSIKPRDMIVLTQDL